MFRKHGRTAIRCPMHLWHQQLGGLDVVTRDISASGIFIGTQQETDALTQLRIGDLLEAQVESLDQQAERVRLLVTRLARDGCGLAFV